MNSEMKNNIKYYFIAIIAAAVLYSCSPAKSDRTGHEYMPDMAHSIAYEVQSYSEYYFNTWDKQSLVNKKRLAQLRLPVNGTIPRGYAGVFFADEAHRAEVMSMLHGANAINAMPVPINGSAPYYYENNEDERIRASREIIANPYPITEAGLTKGKELYTIYCGICHGEKGDGAGYLVRDPNPAAGDAGGVYPAAPANFMLDTFLVSSNGRFYHAIMYGKNVMGGYSDKLNYEERWQVIHYIRSLQAESKKLKYNATVNELNPAFGTPQALASRLAQQAPAEGPAPGASAPASSSGKQ